MGADVSQNATGSVDVIITPAQRLPFDSSSFAGVLCAQVLEHVLDPVMLLDEICRILRHGGQLILTCPFVWELHEEPHDYPRFTKYWLAQNLENAGFSRTEIIPQGGDIAMIGQCILLLLARRQRHLPNRLQKWYNEVFAYLDRRSPSDFFPLNYGVLATK